MVCIHQWYVREFLGSCLGILHICTASILRHKSNPSPFHQSLHPFLAEPLPNPHKQWATRSRGTLAQGAGWTFWVPICKGPWWTWDDMGVGPIRWYTLNPEVGSWMKKSWQHAKKILIFPVGESYTLFFCFPTMRLQFDFGECVWFLEFPTINANLYSIQIFSLPEGDRYLEIRFRFGLDIP